MYDVDPRGSSFERIAEMDCRQTAGRDYLWTTKEMEEVFATM